MLINGVQLKYDACSICLLSFCGMLTRLPTSSSDHSAKKLTKVSHTFPAAKKATAYF